MRTGGIFYFPWHRHQIRLVNVNFHSIRNKHAEVLNLIHSTQADVLVGTETWLTPDHLSSEYFPTDRYEVFRKDRPDGYGGVLIAVSREFLFEEVQDMRTDGGLWVKTNFAGQPALYLGAFYRPNQRAEHLDSLSESLATLKVSPTPCLPPKCKTSNTFVSCVCFLYFSVLYDQNTVIIHVNLMPNYFSQYCMLGCF